jgi:hypothetical protein
VPDAGMIYVPARLHVPVKLLRTVVISEVKVILRNPEN